MKKTALLVSMLFALISMHLVAQEGTKGKSSKLTKQDKNLYETANDFYKQGNYLRAIDIYKVLAESYPNNAEILYKAGICYLNKPDEKAKSIEFITAAGALNAKLEDYNFNLGRAYHANYKFEEAIKCFDNYIKENPPIVKKNLAQHYIEFCKNGEVVKKSDMIIENIGPPINTENAEYVPAVSADESVLIFTYKGERSTGGMMDENFNPSNEGEYYEDVFISNKIGSKWTEPQSIGENINTKGHDASISLSTDGQKLFIFKSTPKDKGDIYMSKLNGEIWSKPERLGPSVNTPFWEGSVSMSADEETLYFASERPGGLGGRDIYKAQKLQTGEWGPAVNLGPKINTAYDEDAPFIHPDDMTLFFSSKGHNSLGGYDIFYSSNKTGDWSDPVNMGMPVNTTEDDLYYVLTPSGETGYYSSNRKEGYGDQDIYVITPGLTGARPILALAVGQVLLDSKPIEASIRVTNVESGTEEGVYKSNSATGKYIISLPVGTNYKIAIEAPGIEPHYEFLNAKALETFVQLPQDFKLTTPGFAQANNLQPLPSDNLQKNMEEQLKIYKAEADPEVYEARMYKDLLKKLGTVKKDSLTYTVDLGTYETSADFNSAAIIDIGKLESAKKMNGGTDFFVGGFPTMQDAEDFRQKAIAKNAELANTSTVMIKDNGTTKLLQEYYFPYYIRKDYVVNTEPKLIKTKPNPELDAKVETEKMVGEYGSTQIAGVTYKVELASVENPADFKMQTLSKYGKIESKKEADGKTHYTIGNFKTLKESDDFKKMLEQKEPETNHSTIVVNNQTKSETIKEFFNDPVMKDKLDKAAKPVLASSKAVKPTTSATTSTTTTSTANTSYANTSSVGNTSSANTASVSKSKNETQVPANSTKPEEKIAKEDPTPCETGKPYDFTAFVGKTLKDPGIYNQLLNVAGAMCVEGLTFKVQVSAYRHPENFKSNNLTRLPYPVENNNSLGDGITRFTVGEFKTLTDSEKLRQLAIRLGTNDAWITAIYNGKRYTLEELIPLNFFNKAVN